MRAYLKVKVKSLASEAVIIRTEERRCLASIQRIGDIEKFLNHRIALNGLESHRKGTVRNEMRATLLAYGFLRGLPLSRIEATSRTMPNWERVEAMVRKYGTGDIRERMQSFSAWKETPVNSLAA